MKYDPRSNNEPSGVRLIQLMNTRLPRIIREELKNESRICLYETGGYWTAFEQSAYRLCRLFPSIGTSIVMQSEHPFPVVMACVPDGTLRAYSQNHVFYHESLGYKELIGEKLSIELYRTWHCKIVRKFITAPGFPTRKCTNGHSEA